MVDFPEPDSPIRAKTSPGFDRKANAFDDRFRIRRPGGALRPRDPRPSRVRSFQHLFGDLAARSVEEPVDQQIDADCNGRDAGCW